MIKKLSLPALMALGLGVSMDAGAPALVLPESTAELIPVLRCHAVVTQDAIIVDGMQVLKLEEILDDDGQPTLAVPDDERRGQLVTRLYDRLLEKVEDDMALYADARKTLAVLAQRPELERRHELLVSIDQATPFPVVREVLYTAGQAQYGSFLLVTHNPWLDKERVIEIRLPSIGPPRQIDPDEEPPLYLSVAISDRGLDVLGADRVLDPENPRDTDAEELAPMVPCHSGGTCTGLDDYDWDELTRLLGLVKAQYPDVTKTIVVPTSDVSYDVLVRTLDHARWQPGAPSSAEAEAWEPWTTARQELFPEPIVAGGVK